jgi:hypothetical protein
LYSPLEIVLLLPPVITECDAHKIFLYPLPVKELVALTVQLSNPLTIAELSEPDRTLQNPDAIIDASL